MEECLVQLHLGDGAYMSVTKWGEAIITANHHDPAQATDKVRIDPSGMEILIRVYQTAIRERDSG
jgi:hypothetical protein